MLKKKKSTKYIPERPLMAWDGQCGFCHYWVIKWKINTGDRVEYTPFQQVYSTFADIDHKEFKKAIHFIDTDGNVYAGAGAVFRALHKYGARWRWLLPLYERIWIVRLATDGFYMFVSRNRNWIYRVTVRLFGKNPARPKHYWAYYLGVLLLVTLGIVLL